MLPSTLLHEALNCPCCCCHCCFIGLPLADTVRPMLELIWAPLLGAFSLLFDEYSDPRLLAICLAGFEAATCLAAQLGVTQLRDVFVNSLCNFTHLHTPR